jgi:hypothetical protein
MVNKWKILNDGIWNWINRSNLYMVKILIWDVVNSKMWNNLMILLIVE